MSDRRDFYVRTLKISWSSLTVRERKRLLRRHPIIAISLDHLIREHLIDGAHDG